MVAWRDMLVHLFYGYHMTIVRAGKVLLDTGVSGNAGYYYSILDETSCLTMYGRGAHVWRGYLFYASKEKYKMISVNLAQVLDEKKLNQTEYPIDCLALDIHKSHLVCVSERGKTNFINLKKQKIDTLDQIAVKMSLSLEDNEVYQAVGISDNSILLGSRFWINMDQIQRLTLMSGVTLKTISSIDITPNEADDNPFIHLILYITRRRQEFAVVCNCYRYAHLVAVRRQRMQVVACNVLMNNDFLNSTCKCGKLILVTSQTMNKRFFKLDVLF